MMDTRFLDVNAMTLEPCQEYLQRLKRVPSRLVGAIEAAQLKRASIGEAALVHFWRSQTRFSRAQFGEFTGTDAETVYRWERGDLRITGHPRGIVLSLKDLLENGIRLGQDDRDGREERPGPLLLTGRCALQLEGTTQPVERGVYLWIDDAGSRSLVHFSGKRGAHLEFFGTFFFLGSLRSDLIIFSDPDMTFGFASVKHSAKLGSGESR